MSKLLAMMMKPKNYMYATIKGSLMESPSGVFSGFSASNYLALQQPFKLNADTVAEFKFKVNFTSLTAWQAIFGTYDDYGISLSINNSNHLYLNVGNGSNWTKQSAGTTTILTNIDYWIKLIFNNNNINNKTVIIRYE